MHLKHKITFKDIELDIGYWSEFFPIQKWTDKELLDYFWEVTKVQSELTPDPLPYRDLVNLIVEIDRRGLVKGGDHVES